jgi:hypothetical protein
MITLNVGGCFAYPNNFLKCMNKLKHYKVNSYDSFMYCKWNGGRYNYGVEFKESLLDFYNKKGIGVFLTFSNDVINLNDKEGNYYLDIFNKSNLNGVILVNDNLRKHIRENFKNLKITRSITYFKSDFTDLDLNDYKKAEDLYDYIVPRRIDVLNPDFYNNIDKSKYEIIISDDCVLQCPKMQLHYDMINKYNRGETSIKYKNCIIKKPKVNNFNISELLKIGYDNFKISSRTNSHEPSANLDDININIKKITG